MKTTRTASSLLFLAALALLAACGPADSNAGSPDCYPGWQEACICDDGQSGFRACGETACDCTAPEPEPEPVTGPVLACSPGAVDFPAVVIGDTARATVICANLGLEGEDDPAILFPGEPTVSGGGFAAAWRNLPAGGLAVGAAAELDLSFSAGVVGGYAGSLELGSNGGSITIPLQAWAEALPGCDLDLAPLRLRVGIVDAGSSAILEFSLHNRRADAPCAITSITLCEGTSPEFDLPGGPYEDVVVPAAGEFRVPLRFTPTEDTTADGLQGCVAIEVPPDRTYAIPIDGPGAGGQEPCALLAPNDVDFGGVQVGRQTVDREVQVINTCSAPLVIDRIELNEAWSEEFFLRAVPPPGTTVAPGMSASFTVAYRPEDVGIDLGSVFVYMEGRAEPFMATLRAEGSLPTHTETFHQAPRPKFDVLVVIDNGTSMAAEAPWIAAQLGGLADLLFAAQVDFHLAVTTTGLVAEGPGCPGGANGGEDGRLFPVDGARPRVLDRATPDLAATWAANLAVGTCHTAPPQLLEAALRALTPPLSTSADDPRHAEANDGNLGFLRPDAHLKILGITDRVDVSPGADASYLTAFQALGAASRSISFNAIAGDPVTGCTAADGRSAAAGGRLSKFVESMRNGEFDSICAPALPPAMSHPPAFGFQTCFTLEAEPYDADADGTISELDGELAVSVDGVALASTVDGELAWAFRRDLNAVCFGPRHVPLPGSTIEVEYRGW